jgi:Cdc6-like AAA superfamily ATPase
MKTNNQLKIVVSGFPGTGKTTLVNALSKELSLPIIQENMLEIGSLNRELNIAIKQGRKQDLPTLIKQYSESFLDWDAQRGFSYQGHEGFIADRWEADLLDYWLFSSSSFETDFSQISATLLKNLRQKSKSIDFCVLTSLTKPFSAEKNEEGNTRAAGFTMHLRNLVTTVGLIKTFTKTPLIILPDTKMSVDERVDFLKKSFSKIRTIP